MTFTQLSAHNVLAEGSLPEYERGMEFFYRELVFLNTDIFIVEQILRFPLSLFATQDNTIFFGRVVDNFLNSGLLIVTKIATDNGPDLYTIRGFRNRLFQLVRPEYQTDFRDILRQSRFDQNTEDILGRARELRNGRIAHATQALAFQIPEQDRIDFAELVQLRDALNAQLDALSFNTEHMMLPIPYNSRVERRAGGNHSTDIEEVLDAIARNSTLLNMPEQEPQDWSFQRAALTGSQINHLNHYRRKFKLSEV
jgi:hypothetical protein